MSRKTFLSNLGDLDLFGIQTPLPLNIKGKEKVHSCLGLLLTFLTVIFLTVIAIIIFINFLNRSSPSVVQSNLKGVLQHEPFYINSENNHNISFNFGFGVYNRDDKEFFIDPSYYTVYAVYIIWDREENRTLRHEMQVPLCSPGKFRQNSYCLSSMDPDGAPAHILGYTDIYIDIVIQPCVNESSKVTCAPQEEIDNKIGHSVLYIYREDWSIDPMNFESPINPIDPLTTAFIVSLTPWNYKTINLYLNKIEVVTDVGWLFDHDIRQNVTTLEEYVLDFQERFLYQDPYALIRIQTKCNKVVYNRKYAKIQDVLAQVDGLATFLLLVFCFVILPYSRVKMQENLVNEAFKIGTVKRYSSPSDQNSPKSKSETKEKESRTGSKCKCIITHNKSASLEKAVEIQVKETFDLSIPKISKSQSQPSKQSRNMSDSKGEVADKSDSLCLSIKTHKPSDEKPPYLIKPLEIVEANNNKKICPKTAKIELPSCEKEAISARQHQLSSQATLYRKEVTEQRQKQDRVKTNSNDENIQRPQEQDILILKSSLGADEINLHLEDNKDAENHSAHRVHKDVSENQEIYLTRSTPKIRISFCEWLLSLIKGQSQVKTLKKASSELSKNLDLITLSRAIAEIEILKSMLLNPKQRILFEDLSTPLFSCDLNSIELQISNERYQWNEKELEEAYLTLSQCPSKSPADIRFLSLYRKKRFK